MTPLHHVIAGAHESLRLVRDDADRSALVSRIVAGFGDALLAYCIMDTHIHLVVEAARDDARTRSRRLLRAHVRSFGVRHRSRLLLRGPVEVLPIASAFELGRTIRYVHENPTKTHEPIVTRPEAFEWSSARAFAGLVRAGHPNVPRCRELLAQHARWALPPRASLAIAERRSVPTASPRLIAAAAAQAFGLRVEDLVSASRAPEVEAARRAFMVLGRLESYFDRQLAPEIGRSRARANALAAGGADAHALRIARTLLDDPELRMRLQPLAHEHAVLG